MANNFDKNFTTKLAKGVLDGFESNRVLSKTVNTQKLDGKFNPDSGDKVLFKRPTDYVASRTAKGDITGEARSSIIRGNAEGNVQPYITVSVDYDEADEALKMGNDLPEFFNSISRRLVSELESDFGAFVMANAGLLAGTPGTAVTSWGDVAEAGAVLESTGVPSDGNACYFVNSYTQRSLANDQKSLGAGGAAGSLIKGAYDNATIAKNFAGMNVMTAQSLATYTTGSGADRSGTLAATPTAGYAAVKDTMVQSIAVAGFAANMIVPAGQKITVPTRHILNQATRKLVTDATGAPIGWSGTVTAEVTLDGSGEGTLLVSGPAIHEAGGAFNTVKEHLQSGDVCTFPGAADSIIQPNMFWHKNAFSIGSVPIKKLHSTDTLGTSQDGLQIRVSKYSDGDANKNIVRFDLRPAYAVLNPYFAGHGHGVV
jgi:hypothetical protein